MKYKYSSLVIILLIGFQPTMKAQSPPTPGGVDSPIFWFTTFKDSKDKSIWKDDENTRKTIFMEQKSNSRNINFHDAYLFDGKQEIVLHNCKASQSTIISAFYPEYDASFKLKSDEFYSVFLNNAPIYSYKSTNIDVNKSNISNNFILPYNDDINFKITSNSELNKSMKVGSYTFSRLSDNLNNPWGEESETKMKFNFIGYIPEFIFYGRVLTVKELNRVHSYLAIKYGLTIDRNYYNSNDDIIWDPIRNKTFHNRVSAIGKDINGAIEQPKSNTTYEELYTFSNDADGSNRSVTIGFKESDYKNLPDKNFLFWGDDSGSISRNDLYEINPAFPKLFVTKRRWLMQNENHVILPTVISLGNPLLKELDSKANISFPSYYVVVDDGHLDIQDIFPFKDKNLENFKWNTTDTKFLFGVAEKLRFMVKEAKHSLNENKCNGVIEKEDNYDDFKKGVYYYKKGMTEDGLDLKCLTMIVFKYSSDKLVFYAEGGIGKYNYSVKDSVNTIVKTGTLERTANREYAIDSIQLTRQKKYTLILSDETNQTIELILAIK